MRTSPIENLLKRSAKLALLYLFSGILLTCTSSAQILSVSGPNGQTVSKGNSVTFSVTVVTLLGSPSYQWYFNNYAITGATGTSLTVTNVSVSNIGNYSVAINNGILGSANPSATLTVTDLPPVVNNDAYTTNQNTTLTVAAPGVLANDSAVFAGPLSATLVTNVSHGTLNFYANGGFTYLPATNYYGSDSFSYTASDGMSNSAPATVYLTVLAPPSISAQPQNEVVATNQNATFSVTAGGTAPLSYQWYLQGSLLNGATNSTLTVSNVANRNAGKYSVIITNIVGSITSTSATLTVISVPAVSSLYASNVTTNSATLSASLKSNGSSTTYYFQYGLTTNYTAFSQTNTLASGDNSVAASITNLSPGAVYHFTMVAINGAGTSVSSDSTFTTAYLPPRVAVFNATNVTAGSAVLKGGVDPQGSAVSYYFRFGTTPDLGSYTATNMLGAGTGGSLVYAAISGLAPGTTYYYSIVAVNSGGTSVASNTAFSTLTIPPIQFTGTLIAPGESASKYMELTMSSVAGATFTVLGTADLMTSPTNWTVLGTMTETSSGQYQYNDSQYVTNSCWYYRIKSQ